MQRLPTPTPHPRPYRSDTVANRVREILTLFHESRHPYSDMLFDDAADIVARWQGEDLDSGQAQ